MSQDSKHALVKPTHTASEEGLRWFERLHYYHRFLRYRFRTEQDTIHFIRQHLHPGAVALDIGANKGIVTYFLSTIAGRLGKVIAFEPQLELIPLLGKVRQSFGLDNVELVPLALSDSKGIARMHRHCAGSTGTIDTPSEGQSEVIEIETTTLDDFLMTREIGKIDFIKCDVDGYEMPVLKGAKQTLSLNGPTVVIEISEESVRVVSDFLYELGYLEGVFIHQGKTYPESRNEFLPYRHPKARFRNFLFQHQSRK